MYDLMVIGGGPTGYVAAERAGERGLKALVIEQKELGGVCLNEGCIPSKTLLNSAKIFYYASHGERYGVQAADVTFDLARVNQRKADVIHTLRRGVAGLMKRNQVDVVNGSARLAPGLRVEANGETYQGKNILVATGSSPALPPIPGIDGPGVVDSTGLLALEQLPQSLVVIGGGVIGCEFACVFGSIGIPVTVIEMLPEICPAVDPEIAKLLRSELAKKNITFHVGAKVEEITEDEVRFSVGEETQSITRDLVLVATGRTCNVDDLGLEGVGVDFDRRGIRIDDRCATNVPGIWAGGDATGKVWLAHAGSRMGEVIVNNLTGRPDRMRYDTVAGVIYTNPEVATVGLTPAEASARGIPVKTAKMPITANGRFLAEHDRDRGLVKVVVHAETDVLLGVHILGAACSEMIFGAAAMIETEFRVREIQDVVFPHPTASESIRDVLFALH